GWVGHFKVKRLFFLAEAQMKKVECLAGAYYGDEVSRLQAVQELCNQAQELLNYDQR
ncbi:hypothetical protein EC988_010297, partial [Linderina pennispora]